MERLGGLKIFPRTNNLQILGQRFQIKVNPNVKNKGWLISLLKIQKKSSMKLPITLAFYHERNQNSMKHFSKEKIHKKLPINA